jgi:galactitol-specific phosphotransferase system IIB component
MGKKVLIGCAVLLGIGITISFGLGIVTSMMVENKAETVSSEASTEASPEAKAPVATNRSWQDVITMTGTASKRSACFTLTGQETVLQYQVKSEDMPGCYIYVVPEGVSIQTDGGIPEVMVTTNSTDYTMLVKKPGRYYLDISSANTSWAVAIKELR